MSFEPKAISRESVPAALQKAERYRIINDPSSAESICLDVLGVDPENEQALVTLLLAITDQFHQGPTEGVHRARQVLARLGDEYKRAYYAGIICERCAKAQMLPQAPGLGRNAYHWFREAMSWYEKAEQQRPAGNDEAILRWNTCARILARHPELQPRSEEPVILSLE
ncbi:MAG TPA: hypothetical protein VFT28_10370 [Gemmatimonadales bacterium]|nr:hypothetical protein [Gemmatimonadales bacterium]